MESIVTLRKRIKAMADPLSRERLAELRNKPIGEQIRYVRVVRHISQKKLAALADVNAETIVRLENGESMSRLDTMDQVKTAVCLGGKEGFVAGTIAPDTDMMTLLESGASVGRQETGLAELADLWNHLGVHHRQKLINDARAYAGRPRSAKAPSAEHKDEPSPRRFQSE